MSCPTCNARANDSGIFRKGRTLCLKCHTLYGREYTMKIGEHSIGEGNPCYLIAEIGINHNGDIDMAKRLIDLAVDAKWDAVKFQKRTIDVVYSKEELAKPRETPFGMTNGDLKRGLEFGQKEYTEINLYCKKRGMTWFASPWDEASVDFLSQFNLPCLKVASASLTDNTLLQKIRELGKPVILSTGMSTLEQIDHAVEVLGKDDLALLHTCSTYPSGYTDLNLRMIPFLAERYGIPIGYSGHETGIPSTLAAVALGAHIIERHITLDRALWGSDQAASLSPSGILQLVRDVRLVELALGDGIKRVTASEIAIMNKLRRVK